MSRHQNSRDRNRARERVGPGAAAGTAPPAWSAAWTAAATSRGLRVDDDVPAEQNATDDLPGMRGRIVRAGPRGTTEQKYRHALIAVVGIGVRAGQLGGTDA
jgi:hypothetical protein